MASGAASAIRQGLKTQEAARQHPPAAIAIGLER